MLEWLQSNGDSFFLNMIYDIFKFTIGYLVAQWLYDGVYKKNKYGGWQLELVDGDERLGVRNITPHWAERIFKDDYDFSIYVKGFASPFVYLSMDVSCAKAKEIGLIRVDKSTKKVIIDKSMTPKGKKGQYSEWQLEMVDGNERLAARNISPHWAERIFKDDYDFSVYVKGFASPYVFLNMDISCDKAKEIGLVKVDEDSKRIIIDKSKNPDE